MRMILRNPKLNPMDATGLLGLLKEGLSDFPYVAGQVSTLGGPERASVLLVVSLQPKSEWKNGILENSDYARFHLSMDGTLEHFSGHGLGKMRKTKFKSAGEAAKKIRAFLTARKVNPRKKNPLASGYSRAAIGENIAHMFRTGHTREPAIVVAINSARNSFLKRFPGKALPAHLRRRKNPSAVKSKRAEKITLVIQRKPQGKKKWETWESVTMEPNRYAKGFVADHVKFLKHKTRQLAKNNPGDSFRIVKR
jgi:hypothetical protein